MSFVHPHFFWIMLIPFVLFVFLVLSNKEKVARVFDEKVLERLRVDSDALPTKVRHLMVFVAIFFMILALSRPVIDKGDKIVSIQGLSLMASIDISGSMRSKDIYPNRLEFAKQKLIGLLKQMPTDEVGLTAFAHISFMLAPFTSDKSTLIQIVEGVDESYINMASTDFTALGSLAAKMLEKKKPKILVVISDGGDKKALEGFADILKEHKITLYAILVGTERGAPVLDSQGKKLKTRDGSIAITQINKNLGEIAEQSGGAFVVASHGNDDIKKLTSKMRAKFHDKKQGDIKIKERVEFFVYPLMLSVLLLLIGFSSLPRKRK
ncbi:MAG: VWA domain-containing protein [Sulfurovum sp.]|nr:VWA domain-containing protein [Sulfurovum sp.]